MEKIPKVEIGSDKIFQGKAIVAFIDILGFSENINKNWNNTENNPLKIILKIKEALPEKVKTDYLMIKGKDGIPKVDIRVQSRVQTISDCFIISHPIKKDQDFDYFSGLYNIVENIIEVWYLLIQNGFTIRGGIAYGDIFWNESEIIGPGYIEAYRNESCNSRVSRVILSSSCNKVLKRILKSPFKNAFNDFFIKDVDGYTIVNPRKLYKDLIGKKELIKKIEIIKNECKDEIIKEKYIPLINILRSRSKYSTLLDY